MSERRVLYSLILYNNIIYQKCSNYPYQKTTFRYDAHALDLRHKFTITHKTTLFKRSFSYQISFIYNKVPSNLKYAPPFKFRKEIRFILTRIHGDI